PLDPPEQDALPAVRDLLLRPGRHRRARADHAADTVLHHERALLLARLPASAPRDLAVPQETPEVRFELSEVEGEGEAEAAKQDPGAKDCRVPNAECRVIENQTGNRKSTTDNFLSPS